MNDLSFLNKSNLTWLKSNTIFLTVVGSQSYGLATPESDVDYKGLAIPPKEYFYGFLNNFEQAEFRSPNPDCCIFNIIKWLKLACDNNPSVIEILWTDPEFYVVTSPYWDKIVQHREKLICKNARWRFGGYGYSQLKKMNRHYRYLKNPPQNPPSRKEFGLPEEYKLPKDQLDACLALIQKKLDQWNFNLNGLDDSQRIELKNSVTEVMVDIVGSSLFFEKENLWREAAISLGFESNFIDLIQKEKEYKQKKEDWKHYQEWKLHRNTKRAEVESKVGYDCYAEETEFLTKDGFKKFDDIKESDLLATIDKDNHIDYQNYTSRFDGTFTGDMYNFIGYHTDIMVTSNHRMFVKKVHRTEELNANEEFKFVEAANLNGSFEIIRALSYKNKNYCDQEYFSETRNIISDIDFLKLIGWYLSDGTFNFRKKALKNIRITQRPDGKLSRAMTFFNKKYQNFSKIYTYLRKENECVPDRRPEKILTVNHPILIKKIFDDCSCKDNKRIPRWVFNLSFRKMNTLLKALCDGDGTILPDRDGIVYYSNSIDLITDVQELAFMCGYVSSLRGPYKFKDKYEGYKPMYQLYIAKDATQISRLTSKSIRKISVSNKRIVCFTVPNSILITRYNGRIAIQGNSKDACALIRLLRMAKEILTTGQVLVRRPDREELLAIKKGTWTYEQVVEYAEKANQELDELYKTTKLRSEPDRVFFDNLCQEIVEDFLK